MMRRYVLDAWALLALLQREEPAATRVKQLLDTAPDTDVERFISLINLGEVVYRVGKVKGEAEAWKTLELLRRLPVTILPADEKAVFAAVRLKMQHAISYADAFAAAAAESLAAILVTGDPELAQLKNAIQLERLERTM
ncbi:MAG: PIN domain-containing protein [Anaerolineae bacterium]